MTNPTVALSACGSYEPQEVEEAVANALSALGGLDRFIQPGMRVAIKTNLVLKSSPESATITHPAVIAAVAKQVMALGATAIIGDSPGGPFTPGRMKSIYQAAGLAEVAAQTGAELNMDLEGEAVYTPEAKRLKQWQICRFITQADAIINCAKLKTHGLTRYTGAVKNLYGCIPGTVKVEYHFRMPELKDFSDMLVDIACHVKPMLSLIDAVVAMEGDGPSAGTPRAVGCLLASEDAHALDVAGCRLMGVPPLEICTVQRAAERGLIDPERVDVVGGAVEDFIVPGFTVPAGREGKSLPRFAPPWALKLLEKRIQPRPVFHHDLCVGCGDCQRSCPPKAISMIHHRPEVDRAACIRCFCCQELCPAKAITIRHNPIWKWMR